MFKGIFGRNKAVVKTTFIDEIENSIRKLRDDIQRDGNKIYFDNCFQTRTQIEIVKVSANTTDGEKISDIITVRTEMPEEVNELSDKKIAFINTMAGLSSLIKDEETGESYIGSRITKYAGDDNYNLYIFLINLSAHTQAELYVNQLKRITGDPVDDSMFVAADNEKKWGEDDFGYVSSALDTGDIANTYDQHSLTAEISHDFQPDSILHDGNISLEIRSDVEHPYFGGGLFYKLALPITVGEQEIYSLSNRLNCYEYDAMDAPPFFGSWCVDFDHKLLAHVGFLPNIMYSSGVALNIATWMMARYEIVGAALENHEI
jgi:hypothetical protein